MRTRNNAKVDRKKILIVDDHPLMLIGLAKMINLQKGLVVCGKATDIKSGLEGVKKHNPDAVIVDITLANESGLDLIKAIHALRPQLPIMALSVHHENLYAEFAIRAGARCYVMKREPPDVLLAALLKLLGMSVPPAGSPTASGDQEIPLAT